ncbi:hypothetical protein SNEBB_006165 [Seison nebaliae]|nr:hypothetical protein SNEBB_006165 [Seison nebaliae]
MHHNRSSITSSGEMRNNFSSSPRKETQSNEDNDMYESISPRSLTHRPLEVVRSRSEESHHSSKYFNENSEESNLVIDTKKLHLSSPTLPSEYGNYLSPVNVISTPRLNVTAHRQDIEEFETQNFFHIQQMNKLLEQEVEFLRNENETAKCNANSRQDTINVLREHLDNNNKQYSIIERENEQFRIDKSELETTILQYQGDFEKMKLNFLHDHGKLKDDNDNLRKVLIEWKTKNEMQQQIHQEDENKFQELKEFYDTKLKECERAIQEEAGINEEKCRELCEQIRELEFDIRNKSENMENLRNELFERTTEYNVLKKDHDRQCTNLTKSVEDMREMDRITKLSYEKDRKEIEELKYELRHYTDTLDRKNEEFDDLLHRHNDLIEIEKKGKDDLKKLESEYSSYHSKMQETSDRLHDKIGELNNVHGEDTRRFAQLEREMNENKGELKRIIDELKQSHEENENLLKVECLELNKQLEEMTNEKDECKRQLTTCSQSVTFLQETLESNQIDYEEKISLKSEEFNDLEKKYCLMEEEHANEIMKARKELIDLFQTSDDNLNEYRHQLENKTNQFIQDQNENKKKMEELKKEYKSEIEKSHGQNEDLRNLVAQLQSENSSLQRDVQQKKSHLELLQFDLETQKDKMMEAQSEKRLILQNRDDIESERNRRISQQNEEMQEQIRKLCIDLDRSNEAINAKEKEMGKELNRMNETFRLEKEGLLRESSNHIDLLKYNHSTQMKAICDKCERLENEMKLLQERNKNLEIEKNLETKEKELYHQNLADLKYNLTRTEEEVDELKKMIHSNEKEMLLQKKDFDEHFIHQNEANNLLQNNYRKDKRKYEENEHQLNEEIERLRRLIDDKNEENELKKLNEDKLEKSLNEERKENNELKKQIKCLNERITNINNENGETIREINIKHDDEKNKFFDDLNHLRHVMKDNEDYSMKLSKEIEGKNRRLNDMELEKNRCEMDNRLLEEKIQSMKLTIKNLESANSLNQDEKKQLINSQIDTNKQMTKLTDELALLQEEKKDIERKLFQMENETEMKMHNYQSMQNRNDENINQYEIERENLNKIINNQSSNLSQLKEEIGSLRTRLTNTEIELNSYVNSNQYLQKNVNDLKKNNQTMNERNGEEIRRLLDEIKTLKFTCEKKEKQDLMTKNKLEEYDSIVLDIKEAMKKKEILLKQQIYNIRKLNRDRVDLAQKNRELEQIINNLKDEVITSQSKIKRLNDEIALHRKDKCQVTEKYKKLQQITKSERTVNEAQVRDIDLLSSEITALKQTLDEATRDINDKNVLNQNLKKSLFNTQQQIMKNNQCGQLSGFSIDKENGKKRSDHHHLSWKVAENIYKELNASISHLIKIVRTDGNVGDYRARLLNQIMFVRSQIKEFMHILRDDGVSPRKSSLTQDIGSRHMIMQTNNDRNKGLIPHFRYESIIPAVVAQNGPRQRRRQTSQPAQK